MLQKAMRMKTALVVLSLWGLAHNSFSQTQTPIKPIDDPKLKTAIEELVSANHILAHEGVMPTYGHISMRSPINPNRMLMSRSLAPGKVTASDIIEMDLDCTPSEPNGPLLYQERFIHCAIYKARADVGAVVHSHTPYMITFSVSDAPLRPVVNAAQMMSPEPVPVHDTSDTGLSENNLIASPESARSLAEKLGSGPVVLMRGHGSTVVAPDVRSVVTAARAVELNAKVLLNAKLLGGKITYLNPKNYGNQRLMKVLGPEAREWNALKSSATGQK